MVGKLDVEVGVGLGVGVDVDVGIEVYGKYMPPGPPAKTTIGEKRRKICQVVTALSIMLIRVGQAIKGSLNAESFF